VFTPKIGLTYEPVPGVSIQGSWGRSFKEPTLFQLATPATVTLSRASTFASGHPATATVLVRNGGNPGSQAGARPHLDYDNPDTPRYLAGRLDHRQLLQRPVSRPYPGSARHFQRRAR
jgi:hypothetical protein